MENINEEIFGKFIKGEKYKIISWTTDIYQLYRKLKSEDFVVDTIEIIKEKNESVRTILSDIEPEQIGAIYLFFDYDGHIEIKKTENRDKLIEEMLLNLSDESDIGKLYLSYPMVEALGNSKI